MSTDTEKDFELMLRRLLNAAADTSPMHPHLLEVMRKANDLLKRKGSASPLKSNPNHFRKPC